MANMNILHECQDARDAHSAARRSGKSTYMGTFPGFSELVEGDETMVRLDQAIFEDHSLDEDDTVEPLVPLFDDDGDTLDCGSTKRDASRLTNAEHDIVERLLRLSDSSTDTLPSNTTATSVVSPPWYMDFTEATVDNKVSIKLYEKNLHRLRVEARPGANATEGELDNAGPFMPLVAPATGLPITTIETLGSTEIIHTLEVVSPALPENPLEEIDYIANQLGLSHNPEQDRAFRIVGEHMVTGAATQLLMYLGGIGGTGKSFVVKAIMQLFRRCGVPESLALSAPTGIATVLIRGYTIHSLTILPGPLTNKSRLEDIWKAVHWLVLDEISMVPALLLSQISRRMCIVKGSNPESHDCPFGGVNIIFAGDFGQLAPVFHKSIFSHELVRRIRGATGQSVPGQLALNGAFLWRQVTTVVELKKNWRHSRDAKYANLLCRIRAGIAWNGRIPMLLQQLGNGDNFSLRDYDVLMTHTLSSLERQPEVFSNFTDAPFICACRSIRDPLNNLCVKRYSAQSGQSVFIFEARDKIGKKPIERENQKRLLRLRSSTTNDSLGYLPLAKGMCVMITENIALGQTVINGATGKLLGVTYEVDVKGSLIAACAFVKLDRTHQMIKEALEPGVVAISPSQTVYKYKGPDGVKFTVSRTQLPLLPAYAMTDYKLQGSQMERAIVDLAGCRTLQSMYVMLLRIHTFDGLAILRSFDNNLICQNLQEEFRNEFA